MLAWSALSQPYLCVCTLDDFHQALTLTAQLEQAEIIVVLLHGTSDCESVPPYRHCTLINCCGLG